MPRTYRTVADKARVAKREEELREIYDNREGFTFELDAHFDWHYVPNNAKRCPVCGKTPWVVPLIEGKHKPKEAFFIRCPGCYLTAEGDHSPEECVKFWNAGRFTEATQIVSRKPQDIDIEGGREMVRAAAKVAIVDTLEYVRKMWEYADVMVTAEKCDDAYTKAEQEYILMRGRIKEAQDFLLGISQSGSLMVAKIKERLYPDATLEQLKKMPKRLADCPEWDEMKLLLKLQEEGKRGLSMAEMKARTKRYYTEYVNHMVRFFLSTEKSFKLDGKQRQADTNNWIAVQCVFSGLTEENRDAVRFIFAKNTDIVTQVREWSELKGIAIEDVWSLAHRFSKRVAETRGLI